MALNNEKNKKLIVKNTLALYMRTAIIMVVSLVVTRVLLKYLGEDNYGIYNVVATVVVLFSFLNASMSQAIQRFITYYLGTGNLIKTREIFSISVISQGIITVFLILICETIGVWFINYKMVIAPDKIYAANWAFQFSILTFCINFMRVPYESSIIAYEKMDFFAYVSIFDAVLKLGIAYGIAYSMGMNRLILYSFLLVVESLVILLIYRIYCIRKFPICRYKFEWDSRMFKEIITFSGWNVFGSMANIFGQKGVVILLNLFVGLIANAAMGVTNQVYSALNSFINSFQTSFRPQIVKSYASNDIPYMFALISSTSKISFILIYVPAILLIFNMPLILRLWLNDVPEYTIQFCRLITICCIIDAVSGPYNCAILATGKIRNYQLWLSISCILDVVLSFIILKSNISVGYVLLSRIATRGLFNMMIGLHYLNELLLFSVVSYIKSILVPILIFLIIQIPVLMLMNYGFTDLKKLLYSIMFTLTIGLITAYFIILNRNERKYLKKMLHINGYKGL